MADHAAVTFLLEQITEVIKGQADLISAAENEFKKLRDDVNQLKAILEGTANVSSDDVRVRLIRNEIREVVYDVEDTIDSWLTESKSKGRAGRLVMNLQFPKKVKSLREVQVKEMLEKAKEMKTALQSAGTSKEPEVQERRMDPEIRHEAVVGLEDEEEKIIGYLMKPQPELDIISIVGMPGLGKTVLALAIFNDDRIRYKFPIRIWVDISQRINSRYVLLEIMKHFASISDELFSMSDSKLLSAVRACLSRGKFLLVLDDVWKAEHWDELRHALPYGSESSKVLITSREMAVSRHVKHITEPHMKLPLFLNESRELLRWAVFGTAGRFPEELESIGNAIAEKCKGIPLTIVVIGGVLKDHYLSLKSDALVREKWYEVAENVSLALQDKKKVIFDAVALSYERLPDHLRECFLYLGVFPAGYAIQTWTLTRLWIAEGFIQPEDNRSLEAIAEDNLNDLISRNLLIVNKRNPMQEVKVCRVDDMIRLFCTKEAEEKNLFKEVRMWEENNAGLTPSDMEKIHRLCLHSELNRFFSANLKGPHVRSFLCFREDGISLNAENTQAIYENFLSLRILHSKSIKFKKFSPKLIKLNHLRYIVLSVPDLDILPDSLSQLWNLQTIVVDTNSNSVTMKASLWKMIRLRHFKTKASIFLEKKIVEGDQAGYNIQTLNRLSPESVPEVSRRTINLKTLGVRGKLALLFKDMALGHLNHLERLKLYEAAASHNRLQHLPDCTKFPPNLKRLTLSRTSLEWKHMSTLAMIPCLEVLKLKDNAFTGISWEAESYTFGKLQCLLILNANLVLWTASTSTFPRLRHLELKNCEYLNAIPDCVLQCLEQLDIGRLRKSIADSAKNMDFQLKLGADLI